MGFFCKCTIKVCDLVVIESVARPVARLRRAEELEPSRTGLVEGRSSAFSLWSLGGRRQKSRGLDCDPCSQPHPQPGGCNEPGFPTERKVESVEKNF